LRHNATVATTGTNTNYQKTMSNTLTIKTLSHLVGREPQTIRLHIGKGYLPAEKIDGAKGWRILTKDAVKWAARMFGKEIQP
jgi:hypothetical protein